MDECGPQSRAREIVFCASSQSGKTEILNNFVGYIIDMDPGPSLVVQPNSKPMGEAWSKDRLAPMLRDTPPLRDKVASPKSRDSGNTMEHKVFPGGHLTIGGANSPAGLASRPIRYLLMDEIDRYEVTKEGHAVSLATRRTQTFWNRKVLKISSPTFEGRGILAEMDDCDTAYRWMLPCMACDHLQYPQMRHFEWQDRDTDRAEYVCENCGHRHPMRDEYRIKLRAQWVMEGDAGPGIKVGYRMNQFGSSLASWRDTLAEFLIVKDSPERLQPYVNTVLCEGWEEPGETADPETLLGRREDYPADCPDGVCILTAGVDVQGDRLEVYVYGYGPGEETWPVDAIQLYGDPNQSEVWTQLDQVLGSTYHHQSGAQLPISAACVDSGGHHTQLVYDFVRTRMARRIYAIKGMAGEGRPIISAPAQKRTGRTQRKVPIYTVGVDSAKAVIMSRLQNTAPGPGYWHMPSGNALLAEEYVAQLTAEKLVTKYRRGFPVKEWIKTRARNEALDCAVYALAALRVLNPSMTRVYATAPSGPKINRRPSNYL